MLTKFHVLQKWENIKYNLGNYPRFNENRE